MTEIDWQEKYNELETEHEKAILALRRIATHNPITHGSKPGGMTIVNGFVHVQHLAATTLEKIGA